jgi:hypothetical protein
MSVPPELVTVVEALVRNNNQWTQDLTQDKALTLLETVKNVASVVTDAEHLFEK